MMKKIAHITFKNPYLLTTALTHRSALNEKKNIKASYERLEFLGDAVLELVVSNYLYQCFPQKTEGELTHLRSQIVQTKTLAAAAKQLNLGSKVILSQGEKRSGGARNISLLADLFEAVVGAVFIDQGLKTASKFIQQHLLDKLTQISKQISITDYKSLLQEKWQALFKATPVYRVVKTNGPDHHKKFVVKVFLKDKSLGEGTGFSKQAAEQQAAKTALEKKVPI